MAKSKNHTNHNQNKKAHKNGIKKPKRQRYISQAGVNPKFIRNARRSIKGTREALNAKPNLKKIFTDIWAKFDKDRSGSLDKKETRLFMDDLMAQAGIEKINDKEFEAQYKKLDQNKDGIIQRDEMRAFLLA